MTPLGTARLDEELLPITAITLNRGGLQVRVEGTIRHRIDNGDTIIVIYAPDGTEVVATRVNLAVGTGHADPGDYLGVTFHITWNEANGWEQRHPGA